MLRSLVVLAVAATLLFIPLQAANATCDITPFVGASVPTKTLIMLTSGSSSIIRNQTHTVYGLGVGASFGKRFGAELVAGAGSGKIEVVGGTALELASTLLLADLRGKVRIAGGDQSSVGLVAGVGYTTQKIGLFDFAKRTDAGEFKGKLTGVVGLSFAAALSDRLHLSMEMVDRIREQGVVLTGTTTGLVEPTQHDVVITAGLSFPLTK